MSQAATVGYQGSMQSMQSSSVGYSRLESIAATNPGSSGHVAYAISTSVPTYSQPIVGFSSNSSPSSPYVSSESFFRPYQPNQEYHFFAPQQEYAFSPDSFLKPGKGTKFIGKAEEVREFVEDTFERIFNLPFPSDIKIGILDEKEFRKIAPSPGTLGLSINRSQAGLLSEIFVLNDTLGRIMLTIGHELGHVLTPTLDSPHDEEAKAYAFSLQWLKVLQEFNIAGLGNALITENPAENGLHNVAFKYVDQLAKKGRNVWEVYLEIVKGLHSVAA